MSNGKELISRDLTLYQINGHEIEGISGQDGSFGSVGKGGYYGRDYYVDLSGWEGKEVYLEPKDRGPSPSTVRTFNPRIQN